MADEKKTKQKTYGNYLILNGERIALKHHATDFSVQRAKESLKKDDTQFQDATRLAPHMSRVRATSAGERDSMMKDLRSCSVAHHIYLVEGTDEEVIISDRIVLSLRHEGAGELEKIMDDYHLEYLRPMGGGHLLRVTGATGMNPIKAANTIAERPEVASCSPELMQQLRHHEAPVLFARQWYLTADLIDHPSVQRNASAEVPEAWTLGKGDPEIVVAVIDDGFDLEHPAFTGTRIHPDAATFVSGDVGVGPEAGDFHGTPVASIAVGSHTNGAMFGIAPDCTFLPVQLPFGSGEDFVAGSTMLEVFEFVSSRADVVNCSFGFPPSTLQSFTQEFRNAVTQLTVTGGRRGTGLVIVFSAGNDDAPTFLSAAENVNGVRYLGSDFFTGQLTVAKIPKKRNVYTAYPMIPGVLVVGAMSSRTRKSGYSNWGPHLTVTAPSSNGHELNFRDSDFTASQPGLGQIAASNRPGRGAVSDPLGDDPRTPINEGHYTASFGGTSGAAPVVAGVAALMLSINPTLTAAQVSQILQATADNDLDTRLDLADDPNLQGLSGEFSNGSSRFFGAGKVNAARAVRRAQALPGGIAGGVAAQGSRDGSANPNERIPDDRPEGITSSIDITGEGPVRAIRVDIDITHSYRGDLRVILVSPQGRVAILHNMTGSFRDDLKQTYTAENNDDLANLVRSETAGRGRWTLNVSDNLRRDVGTLNAWRLDLRES